MKCLGDETELRFREWIEQRRAPQTAVEQEIFSALFGLLVDDEGFDNSDLGENRQRYRSGARSRGQQIAASEGRG